MVNLAEKITSRLNELRQYLQADGGDLEIVLEGTNSLTNTFGSEDTSGYGILCSDLTIRGTGLKTIREAVRVLALHRPLPKNIDVAVDVDAQYLM